MRSSGARLAVAPSIPRPVLMLKGARSTNCLIARRGTTLDRFWACSNLVGEKITGTRQQEADADQYAALLLATIPHPSPPKRLRFELGALFLLNAELDLLGS